MLFAWGVAVAVEEGCTCDSSTVRASRAIGTPDGVALAGELAADGDLQATVLAKDRALRERTGHAVMRRRNSLDVPSPG